MFTPYDYQLDYLKALHLFYYAFPNPIHVQYFTLSNEIELGSATKDTKSVYTHLLDDTSIAKYEHIINLPVYNTEGNSPKQQNADEFGNTYLQPEMTIVIPAIYGFQPKTGDFVQFKTTGLSRLYQISNIEHNNVHEMGNLKLYKLTLKIDKNEDETLMLDRIIETLQYSHEFAKIMYKKDYDYVHNNLINLLNYHIAVLDNQVNDMVNSFMSKFYNDFKIEMMVMLEKFNYTYFDLLKKYTTDIFTNYFSNPQSFQIPLTEQVPDIVLYTEAIQNYENKTVSDTLPLFNFFSDLLNEKITLQDYQATTSFSLITVVYFLLKEINAVVTKDVL